MYCTVYICSACGSRKNKEAILCTSRVVLLYVHKERDLEFSSRICALTYDYDLHCCIQH